MPETQSLRRGLSRNGHRDGRVVRNRRATNRANRGILIRGSAIVTYVTGSIRANYRHTTAYCLEFRGLSEVLASSSFLSRADGQVMVFDSTTGKPILTLQAPESRFFSGLSFSPDGQRLASLGYIEVGQGKPREYRLTVWDVTTGQQLPNLGIKNFPGGGLAFSPDGRYLAGFGSFADRQDDNWYSMVMIWDGITGREIARTSHLSNKRITALAFSPDSKRLAVCSDDETVRIWDATRSHYYGSRSLLSLRGQPGGAQCVAFSSDGRRLASASSDGTMMVWDATSSQDSRYATDR